VPTYLPEFFDVLHMRYRVFSIFGVQNAIFHQIFLFLSKIFDE